MKLVLLDRDGVINHDSEDYIKSPEEWQPIPGSLQAIAQLNHAGINVAIVSNQSGVGRGMFSETILQNIHDKLHRELNAIDGHIDHIYYCPHHPDNGCDCRKPKPGMVEQALKDFHLSPNEVCFVGDSIRDLQAAEAVGVMPALVLTGNGKKTVEQNELDNVKIYEDLAEFVDHLTTSITQDKTQ